MKIVIHTSHLNTPYWDGNKIYLYYILINLLKIDQKNQYFLCCQGNPKFFELNKNNFKYIITRKWPAFWTQTKFLYDVKKINPDVVWLPHQTVPVFFPKKIPLVITIHDIGHYKFPKFYKLKERILLDIFTKHAAKRANRIIVPSNSVKKNVIKILNVKESKIERIYEGYYLLKKRRATFIKTQNKYKIRKPYLLYLGAIQPRKNLYRLITVFNILKKRYRIKHSLVLAGGQNWLSKNIREKAKLSKYRKEIIFTGEIKEEEKFLLYKNADIFIYPSLWEGFGIPILEAMSCGCSVAGSNVSSIPEIGAKAMVYFDPYSIDDMVKNIINLLNDKNKKLQLKEKGKQRINKFCWEKTARETLKVILNLNK